MTHRALTRVLSQAHRPKQTVLIIVQSRETEIIRSVHSSDHPEKSMLYIYICSIPADT